MVLTLQPNKLHIFSARHLRPASQNANTSWRIYRPVLHNIVFLGKFRDGTLTHLSAYVAIRYLRNKSTKSSETTRSKLHHTAALATWIAYAHPRTTASHALARDLAVQFAQSSLRAHKPIKSALRCCNNECQNLPRGIPHSEKKQGWLLEVKQIVLFTEAEGKISRWRGAISAALERSGLCAIPRKRVSSRFVFLCEIWSWPCSWHCLCGMVISILSLLSRFVSNKVYYAC